MSDDEFITRREINLREENLTLKFAKIVGDTINEKFQDWEERWEGNGEKKYQERVLELTGESVDNVHLIREGMQHAIKGAVSEKDTKNKIKGAVIGISLPSIAAAAAWFANHFKGG